MNDSPLELEPSTTVETDEHAEITKGDWFWVHMNLKKETMSTAKSLHVKLEEHPVNDDLVLFRIAGATGATQKQLKAWVSKVMKSDFETRQAEKPTEPQRHEILPFPDGEKPTVAAEKRRRQHLA